MRDFTVFRIANLKSFGRINNTREIGSRIKVEGETQEEETLTVPQAKQAAAAGSTLG
jgi:hypothetical protein